MGPRKESATFPLEAPASTGLRVAICDEQPARRIGLRTIVESVPGWQVVADYDSGEAPPGLADARPDVVVMGLPHEGDAGAAVRALVALLIAGGGVLALSSICREKDARAALAAGARGLVLSTEPVAGVREAIRRVGAGQRYVSPVFRATFAQRVLGLAPGDTLGDDVLADLSPRERQVFTRVAAGLSNQTIARELGISPKTVDAHRQRLNGKLDCHREVDVVRFAVVNGLWRQPPPGPHHV